MTDWRVRVKCSILFCIATLCCMGKLYSATDKNKQTILIVSSYNPDSQNTSANISEFIDEYNRLKGPFSIQIENMNCKSFSESKLWKNRMKRILDKYRENRPQLIILLGQEAWASYISQEDIKQFKVPAIVAMVSKNAVILPDEHVTSLKDWFPKPVDFISDSLLHPVRGGFVYEYDIENNIRLIRELYPNTKNIVFISDNTYGGVSMQAWVKEEMKKIQDINLILLDGRCNTVYTVADKLSELPDHTVILLGTWRIDENDGYFIRNSIYAMTEIIPHVPAFSISSIGFGHWAIGGVMPEYRRFGKDMARQAIKLLSDTTQTENNIVVIDNQLRIDYKKAKEYEIDLSVLPPETVYINMPPSIYELYKYEFWIAFVIFTILLIALIVSLLFYVRTKKLKDELEISEAELRTAKDAAEEANRLKTAFLANMSHEIRTPLNSIVGFSNLLVSIPTTPEEQKSYFDIIQNNSDLLLRLINDVLDISRLETERVAFTYEKYNIIEIFHQVISTMEYSNKSNNKFLLESEYTEYELYTDIQRLQQVLINLLSNANKFTKDGEIRLKFEVEIPNNRVLFFVTDTGCGIPANKISTVFERFEKLNESSQGSGLGLAICRLITQKWGGDIWVDSTYKEGARFVFSHPIYKQE